MTDSPYTPRLLGRTRVARAERLAPRPSASRAVVTGRTLRFAACDGISLLELLVYLVIFGTVLNISAQALISCVRLSHYGSAAADRMEQTAEVERAFRQAVRQADAVVDAVGAYKTGPGTVVLEQRGAEDGDRQYTVMGNFWFPESVSKLTLRPEGNDLKTVSLVTYPLKQSTVQITYDRAEPRDARLVSMDLTTRTARASARGELASRITEALRGKSGDRGPAPSATGPSPVAEAVR